MTLLMRALVAAVYGAIAWLICIFAGTILAGLGIPIVSEIGALLAQYALIIGALVFLLYFARGNLGITREP